MSKKQCFPSRYLRLFLWMPLVISICFSTNLSAKEEEAPKVPFDFLMDVLKPLGMPLVTSYHTMRENIFFNTRMHEASTLESIGNFLLSPAQYLFAGKNVCMHLGNSCDFAASQCFDYDRLYWAKTLLSLIALPIASPLGASIKGIAYLFPDVRKRHKDIEKTLRSPFIQSHLENYLQKGIRSIHCDEFIPCQGHKRPSHLTKRQKIERETLKEIIHLLDENNIIYWIDCGTCLGAYRYGGMIPWDIDIDIAIFQADHDNVKRLLSTLDPEKYQIQDWSSYSKPQTFLKLYVKETKNLIDIYHYKFDDNGQTISYFYSYEDSPFPESWKRIERKCTKPLQFDQVFPLKKAKFDGLIVWAPHRIEEFLQTKYGENLDPCMLWDETSHAYVKVQNHSYWIDYQ